MNRRTTADILFRILILALIAALCWPVFVAVATAIGHYTGEAWQLDAWHDTPKRQVLASFLDGYRASAPFALGIGALAVLDHLLLSRSRITWMFGGILLPLGGLGLFIWKFTPESAALPVLVGTGVLLAILYRLLDAIWYRYV